MIRINKAKETVSATTLFLERLSVNEYIKDNLKSLQNSMGNLLKALLSYSNDSESVFRNIEVKRLLFPEELKSSRYYYINLFSQIFWAMLGWN